MVVLLYLPVVMVARPNLPEVVVALFYLPGVVIELSACEVAVALA